MPAKAIGTLQQLRLAMKEAGRVALQSGIWPEGQRQKAYLAALFETGKVVDEAGNQITLPRTSWPHTRWKARNSLDPRRFHMTNTLQRAFHAPQSFLRTQWGFTISLPRANFQAVIPAKPAGPGQRGRKERKTFLANYFRFINARASGRLGRLGLKQRMKVRQAGVQAIEKHLVRIMRAAIRIRGGQRIVTLELGKLGLEG